ncbi:hypothetical protein K3725_22115 (plasmid) [Leisingera sp. S132]|uniref:lipopolysaccharide biosynthesis protein n=1 Tax=Leisingera sp. S132 TaxID=2867016 RepID=UPI0021A2BA7A|nr:hypothetical protein [Leisingera sp. S132]UWQ81908.1 hypothetical protein K3725_22115 [Leisingera sp. S132]
MTQASGGAGRSRSLVSWGLLGQAAYVATQFVLLVALARFSSVETVGYFGLASAIIIPVYWLMRLDLRVNLASDSAQRYRFSEFLLLLAGTMALAYLVLAGLALTVFDPAARPVLLLFGLAKLAETFSELCYGMFQKEHRMTRVARSQILRGTLSMVLFGAVMALTRNAAAGFLSLCLVWAGMLLCFDLPAAIRTAQRLGDWGPPRRARMLDLFRRSLPLGMNGLLSALQGNMPRYAAERLIGIAALGQLTVVLYAMQAMTTVAMAASHSLTATFARQAQEGNRTGFFRTLHKLLAAVWMMALAATAAAALWGDWILTAVFGPDFAGLGLVLTIAVFGAGLRASVLVLQGALLAARRFGRNLQVRAAMLCLMALLCAAGGWAGGLTGIAAGMSASFLMHSGLLWLALRREPFGTPGAA